MAKHYIDIQCSECDHVEIDFQVNSGETSYDMLHVCPACGGQGTATRVFSDIQVIGKASTRDGTPRPGFTELKRKLDVQIESYKLPASERGEHNREINRLSQAANQAISKKGKDYDRS